MRGCGEADRRLKAAERSREHPSTASLLGTDTQSGGEDRRLAKNTNPPAGSCKLPCAPLTLFQWKSLTPWLSLLPEMEAGESRWALMVTRLIASVVVP